MEKSSKHTYPSIYRITITFGVIVMLFLSSGCQSKRKTYSEAITSRDSVAGMITRGVTTLISDSGVVKYKIIAEEWEVFDKLNPPLWTFEKGVYLEKYSAERAIDATITADTAYYYERNKLWELRGNVHVENEKQEKFDTQLLFWDEKGKKVYSNLPIRIEQKNTILTGIGFTSNQQFTDYVIRNTTAILPVEDK